MRVLLAITILVTLAGVALLGSMFVRKDNRLGLTGVAVLIAGESMALVYAVLEA